MNERLQKWEVEAFDLEVIGYSSKRGVKSARRWCLVQGKYFLHQIQLDGLLIFSSWTQLAQTEVQFCGCFVRASGNVARQWGVTQATIKCSGLQWQDCCHKFNLPSICFPEPYEKCLEIESSWTQWHNGVIYSYCHCCNCDTWEVWNE